MTRFTNNLVLHKKLLSAFVLLMLLWVRPTSTIAQTASDYYLPLCEGNFLHLNTTSHYTGTDSSGWSARWILYKIHKPATINGKVYYMQKGTEILHQAPDSSVFHRLWLRKDEQGNIVLGAIAEIDSDHPDSAFKLPEEMTIFPNSFLTVGNKIELDEGSGRKSTDSVVSTTATVGSYTNCIQVRTTRKKNNVLDHITDYYYAYKVGHVRTTRIYPYYQVHQVDLINHLANNCYTALEEANKATNQPSIYPNPANHQLVVSVPNSFQSFNVRVCNSMGQLITDVELNNENNTLLTSDWSNGLYVISITSNGQTYYTRLLISH